MLIDSRTRRLYIGVFALLLMLVQACGTTSSSTADSTPSSPEPFNLLYFPGSTVDLGPLIADKLGFFQKNALTPTFTSTTDFLTPILSGSADLSLPAPPVAALAITKGEPLKVLMTNYARIDQQLLVRPDFASSMTNAPGTFPGVITELKGKRVAITVVGGSLDLDLRYLVSKAGLNPAKDITIVPAGGLAQEAAALKSKQVDAIFSSSPVTQQLTASGAAVDILDLNKQGPASMNMPFVIVVCTESWLSGHQGVAKRFVTAMTQAFAFMRNPANRAKVKQVVAGLLSMVDPSLLDSVVDPLISASQPAYTTADVAKVNDFLSVLNLASTQVQPDSFIVKGLTPST